MKENDSFGYLLRRIRRRYDLTQEEAAELIDVSVSSFAKYESGQREIPIKVLVRAIERMKLSRDEAALLISKRIYELQKKILKDIYPGLEIPEAEETLRPPGQLYSGMPYSRNGILERQSSELIDYMANNLSSWYPAQDDEEFDE